MADPTTPSITPAEKRPTSSGPFTPTRNGSELVAAGGPHGTVEQNSGGVIDRVKQGATAQLSEQKERGIAALGSVAQAVRSSTQRLRDEKHDTIASYVDQAADRIETWSRRLKEKDVDELVADVQTAARRKPAVFIGSAFALGLLGARFLKSSRAADGGGHANESQRARHAPGARMSAASDRGASFVAGDAEVEIASEGVAVSDVKATVPGSRSSGGDYAGARSSRARKPGSRTEKS